MAAVEFALSEQDFRQAESLLQGFDEKASTNFFWNEDTCSAESSPSVSFLLDSSSYSSSPIPSSPASSPISSPMYQIPSSPTDSLASSSSDEFEQAILASTLMETGFPMVSDTFAFTDFSALNLPVASESRPFTFDASQIKMNESPFGASCLPPLPLAAIVAEPAPKSAKTSPRNSKDQKAPRKRRKTSAGSKFAKLDLSEEEMLKFTGEEMEEYIRTLSSTRTLSPAEEKELKRVRRLVKNREYAQSSRDKRKQHMEEVEEQLQGVAQEKATLQQRVNELELENKALKFHLAKILASSRPSPSSPKSTSVPTKAAAVSFFVLLFSFGLFCFSGSAGSFTGRPANAFESSFAPRSFKGGRMLLELDLEESLLQKILPSFLHDFVSEHNAPTSSPCEVDPHGNECMELRMQRNCVGGACSTGY